MNRRRWSIVLLVLAVVGGVAVRLGRLSAKRTITYDEGISYLAATGHEAAHQRAARGAYPFGAWAESGQWRRFVMPEEAFCFDVIGHDLAHIDFHPPLYFWMLHLWSLLVGVATWTGPILNILLAALATVLLWCYARTILGDSCQAAFVAFVWALSAPVALTSIEARQYDLLALCTIAFAWRLAVYIDTRRALRPIDHMLLILVTAAGALTHYHFAIVVAGGCLWACVRLIGRDRIRLVGTLVSACAGYALLALLHPRFYLPILRFRKAQGQPLEWSLVAPRIGKVGLAISRFFMPVGGAWVFVLYVLLSVAFVAAVVAATVELKRGPGARPGVVDDPSRGIEPVYWFGWMFGVVAVLYVLGMSPAHAMRYKYLSHVWPFLAFLPVLLFRLCGRYRPIVIGLAYVCLAASAVGAMQKDSNRLSRRSDFPFLHEAERVLVDDVTRGVLVRIIWHTGDDAQVYAATREHLLQHGQEWLPGLKDEAIYLAVRRRGEGKEVNRPILDLMRGQYDIKFLGREFCAVWEIRSFRVAKKAAFGKDKATSPSRPSPEKEGATIGVAHTTLLCGSRSDKRRLVGAQSEPGRFVP